MITNLSEYIEDLMIPVEGGEFLMGSSKEDKGAYSFEKPQHKVLLSDFSIGKYPVTQELYELVTNKTPSYFKGAKRPVERVSWYDAVEFCNALSKKLEYDCYYNINKEEQEPESQRKWKVTTNKGANGFRLSTEAEWEYTARGGVHKSNYVYAGSAELDEVGWYDENSHKESKEVGLKAPNALGIYDMSGNVFEWCWDWFGSYDKAAKKPIGAKSGLNRVDRGGSWNYGFNYCRVAYRNFFKVPNYRYHFLGFRLTRAYTL